jgi:hypothetical protein
MPSVYMCLVILVTIRKELDSGLICRGKLYVRFLGSISKTNKVAQDLLGRFLRTLTLYGLVFDHSLTHS